MNRKKWLSFKIIRVNRKKRKGQLNIIEVVLAASILLVLSVSIAQTGLKIAQVSKEKPDLTFQRLPNQIIHELDELGLLRPYFYSGQAVPIQIYLNSTVPKGTNYWLYEKGASCLTNSVIDCSSLGSLNSEIATGNIYLSGYLTDPTPRTVYLTLSKNI